MSFNSKSYSRVNGDFEEGSERFEKEVSYLPVRSYKEEKVTQMSYLKENTLGKQAVFRAEIVKTLTKQQIKNHLSNIKISLEEAEPNKIFKISCHPQSDLTTKSSHFHLWGDVTQAMEKAFEEYLINNRLTVQEKVNITAINRGQLREVTLNDDNKEEIKNITYVKKSGHFVIKNNKIDKSNVTESVVLETIEIEKVKSFDDELEEEFKRALKSFENMQKTEENLEFEDIENIEEFEDSFKETFEKLNQNLNDFLNENENKTSDLEEKIKKILILEKDL